MLTLIDKSESGSSTASAFSAAIWDSRGEEEPASEVLGSVLVDEASASSAGRLRNS